MPSVRNDRIDKENDLSRVRSGIITGLCFNLRGLDFAIDISLVDEIIRPPEIQPLIDAPDFFVGVIVHRDHTVPLMDLSRRLRLGEDSVIPDPRVLIVRREEVICGIFIDDVLGIWDIEKYRIESDGLNDMSVPEEFIRGLYCEDDRKLVVLDGSAVLDFEKLDLSGINLPDSKTNR